jgi:transcriptional regulator with XRE-family HTH domain
MGMRLARRIRERLLEKLEEETRPFQMAHKSEFVDGGWLWAVRTAVGMPVEELARRQDVKQREIYRLEQAERESRITLGALKRAAAAMDCELTYGLTPKRGTLGAMAAAQCVAREKALARRRLELNESRVAEGKPRRGKDAQLAAIKELVRLALIETAPGDGSERLQELADQHLGWNSRRIADVLAAKALKGDRASAELLIESAVRRVD